MKALAWLLVIGAISGIGFSLWKLRRAYVERRQAAEQRYASFLVSTQAKPGPDAPPAPQAQSQSNAPRLLFEAAARASEAGEAALSIQIYARLLSRYPDSPLAAQARAAVEAQKKKVSTPQNSA